MAKKTSKSKIDKITKRSSYKGLIGIIVAAIVAAILGFSVNLSVDNGKYEATIKYSDDEVPAVIDDNTEESEDKGEYTEDVPTIEEVDGGKFEDIQDGVSTTDGEYDDLGWAETYDVSSPTAFKNAVLGKCVVANNKFGAQCVSLARVFWWSYANRDVSTCGTGAAKGMMNCKEQNAGKDFNIITDANALQAGDWVVFNGGMYGHVGMALGPTKNGYVALLGENQGGSKCDGGGSAANIINISTKNFLGAYRPKAYIVKEEPKKPTKKPSKNTNTTKPQKKTITYKVKKGDTLSAIQKKFTGRVDYKNMNNYAKHWYSKTYKRYLTVYDGWVSPKGYGLFAGDTIEYRG